MVGHTGGLNETFVVPVTSGNYAPEVIYLREKTNAETAGTKFSPVLEVILLIESLPASATIEVDVLRPGSATWVNVASETTTGIKTPLPVYAEGVRVRAKSGGTAGNSIVDVFYLY